MCKWHDWPAVSHMASAFYGVSNSCVNYTHMCAYRRMLDKWRWHSTHSVYVVTGWLPTVYAMSKTIKREKNYCTEELSDECSVVQLIAKLCWQKKSILHGYTVILISPAHSCDFSLKTLKLLCIQNYTFYNVAFCQHSSNCISWLVGE